MQWKVKDSAKCNSSTSGTFINYVFRRSLIFMEKHFIALGTLGKASGRIMIGFYLLSATTPLGL
jgi:hypothetical protein